MKHFAYITLAVLFLLFLVVPPAYAQEEAVEEEAVEEVVEEVIEEVVEEAVEEVVEEVIEEAVEEAEIVEEAVEEVMLAEDMEEEANPLAGFTAGLNFGYPVVTGEYFKDNTGPTVGLVVGSPYGFPLGPFNIGVGAGVEAAMMGDYDTEIGAFAVLSTGVYSTPQGLLSLYGGAGFYGGIGVLGGASFDYALPNIPLVIKPYLRATIMSSATAADEPSGFVSIGTMLSYDISTLF